MKKIYFFLVAMLFSIVAFAYNDVKIDGIWYRLDKENKTAMVIFEGIYTDDIGRFWIDKKKAYTQTEIIIPSTILSDDVVYDVTTIESYTFSFTSSLVSITIPNSITSIRDYAFYDCTGLVSVIMGNGVTEIGNSVFYGCTGLTSITIPNSITSIKDAAFSGCTGLVSVIIGNGVIEFGNSVFYGCTGLTSIDVDKDNQKYASVDGVLYNKNITTLISCPEGKTLIEIPNSVTKIEDYAFFRCAEVTSIRIPNGVTEIGNLAFYGCTKLIFIDVDKDNQKYTSVDGVLYNKNITTLIRCPEGKTLIEIPNSVTSIGDMSFCASKLMSVEIPNNVTSIGIAAFMYSTNLLLVEIPNSVTSIAKEAFRDCSSLTSIIIPNSVTEIGSSVFYGCTGLTSIEIKTQNPPIIDNYTFHQVSRFVQIKVPCGSKVKYQTAEYWWEFMNYEEFSPKLTVGVNDETMGFATVTKQNTCDDDVAQVQAQALAGYKFVRWSDGATENPHILLVTEDVTITAEFAINQYEVVVESDGKGIVTGSGTYDYGTEVTIEAIADEGYHFVKWSDGNIENPRTIVVTEDVELTAEFELDGTPVDNVDESSVIVYVQDGVIYVEGIDADYNVFDVNGRLVYTGRDTQLSLPRGVYVIAIDGEVEKVVI